MEGAYSAERGTGSDRCIFSFDYPLQRFFNKHTINSKEWQEYSLEFFFTYPARMTRGKSITEQESLSFLVAFVMRL
jgi:hypothetical protein